MPYVLSFTIKLLIYPPLLEFYLLCLAVRKQRWGLGNGSICKVHVMQHEDPRSDLHVRAQRLPVVPVLGRHRKGITRICWLATLA